MSIVFRLAVVSVVWACMFPLLAENVTTTEDMTAQGDWAVTVAAGETNTVTGVQTGAGKIVKQGAGTLVLAAANTFSGGISLEEGYLHAQASGALGSGEITILGQREGYAGPCELWFAGSNMDLGEPAIHVTGNTSCQYPALCLYGTNNTFSGTITADHSLYFKDEFQWLYNEIKKEKSGAKWSVDVYKNASADFRGAITVAETFHHVPDTDCHFYGPVKAATFDTVKQLNEYRSHDESDHTFYGNIHFHAANQFDVFNYGYRSVYFESDQGLDGAHVTANVPGVTYPRPGTL